MKTFNELTAIANETKEGKAVFQLLGERQRYRERTDLARLYANVRASDETIAYDHFLDVFKRLETIGAGRLIRGRKNNPDRFKWRYNLKDIAEAATKRLNIDSLMPLGTHKRPISKRHKERTSKVMVAERAPVKTESKAELSPVIHLNIQVSPTTSSEDIQALLQLAKSLQG